MSIAFPITGVVLTNLIGLNIMASYKQNRLTQVKKYNEYLFSVIFFNSLSWMLYGIVTSDSLIYLSGVTSLFFDFGFIQLLYKYADPNVITHLEILSGIFTIYFIIIVYMINFTSIDLNHNLLPIIGTVSMVSSVSTNFSPFIIINQVIKTKSNELIYLPQALIGCVNLSCWLAYGLLLNDIYQIITNSLGLAMCVIQLIVYFYYNGNKNQDNQKTNKITPENQTNQSNQTNQPEPI